MRKVPWQPIHFSSAGASEDCRQCSTDWPKEWFPLDLVGLVYCRSVSLEMECFCLVICTKVLWLFCFWYNWELIFFLQYFILVFWVLSILLVPKPLYLQDFRCSNTRHPNLVAVAAYANFSNWVDHSWKCWLAWLVVLSFLAPVTVHCVLVGKNICLL